MFLYDGDANVELMYLGHIWIETWLFSLFGRVFRKNYSYYSLPNLGTSGRGERENGIQLLTFRTKPNLIALNENMAFLVEYVITTSF